MPGMNPDLARSDPRHRERLAWRRATASALQDAVERVLTEPWLPSLMAIPVPDPVGAGRRMQVMVSIPTTCFAGSPEGERELAS